MSGKEERATAFSETPFEGDRRKTRRLARVAVSDAAAHAAMPTCELQLVSLERLHLAMEDALLRCGISGAPL